MASVPAHGAEPTSDFPLEMSSESSNPRVRTDFIANAAFFARDSSVSGDDLTSPTLRSDVVQVDATIENFDGCHISSQLPASSSVSLTSQCPVSTAQQLSAGLSSAAPLPPNVDIHSLLSSYNQLAQALFGNQQQVTVQNNTASAHSASVHSDTVDDLDAFVNDGADHDSAAAEESVDDEGFEGYLNVDLDSDQVVDLYDKLPSLTFTTVVSNVTGVLKIQELSSSSVDLVAGQTQQPVHLMSMVLAIQGMGTLTEHISAQQKKNRFWKKTRVAIASKLRQEAEKYGDILFVNVTDVYRNLPTKLLLFHKWLYNHINASHVLKTDDDCFINIGSVMSALDRVDLKDRDIWWGSFRDQWLVEQWGKWSELTYTADVYPRFGCGAGNVVSRGIHTWLGQNGQYLRAYQGEDVSMGIWMSATILSYIKDDRWKCDKTCSPDSLAIPELSPQEVRTMWTYKETCGDPCGCGAGG